MKSPWFRLESKHIVFDRIHALRFRNPCVDPFTVCQHCCPRFIIEDILNARSRMLKAERPEKTVNRKCSRSDEFCQPTFSHSSKEFHLP